MSKKIPSIKPLPNGQVPQYYITGVSPEEETKVRAHISDFAPDSYPNQIVFLPSDKYQSIAREISKHGTFGGQQVGRGQGAQETFGGGGLTNTQIGNGFSIKSAGRIYLNSDLLKNPKNLKETLQHEFGHISAPSADSSEDTAEKWRNDAYGPRAKAQENLTKEVGDLPLRTLGSALPSTEPTYLPMATQQALPAAEPITMPTIGNTQPSSGLPRIKLSEEPELIPGTTAKSNASVSNAAKQATERGKTLSHIK